MNLQYTLGRSRGNSGGSNEANTAANNARTARPVRLRRRLQQLRRPPHLQRRALLYSLPFGRGRQFGSDWAGADGRVARRMGRRRHAQRSQRPARAGADHRGPTSSIATPHGQLLHESGGGSRGGHQHARRRHSRNVRRPDLVPGVDPFIKDGGLLFLNPAAFAVAAARHRSATSSATRFTARASGRPTSSSPSTSRFGGAAATWSSAAKSSTCSTRSTSRLPVGLLPQAIARHTTTGEQHAAAGSGLHRGDRRHFGRLTSTVGRTVGLGTAGKCSSRCASRSRVSRDLSHQILPRTGGVRAIIAAEVRLPHDRGT